MTLALYPARNLATSGSSKVNTTVRYGYDSKFTA
jgi:hypothetical protein